jgi:hypothetical protein
MVYGKSVNTRKNSSDKKKKPSIAGDPVRGVEHEADDFLLILKP